jgi:hypothetical protein
MLQGAANKLRLLHPLFHGDSDRVLQRGKRLVPSLASEVTREIVVPGQN